MSLLSGFNVTLPQVGLLGEAAMAAFAGGVVPAGWNVITPQQLGVSSQYWDGNYFTNNGFFNNGASAIVLQQGNDWIVSFRGTDGPNDILHYPELVTGTYINHFQPLLSAVASNAPDGTNFYFTGASLGGGATNQLADIAGSQYGGEFASATFVAFASPTISTANGILNLGFENDPIYKPLSLYNDFSSSVDHLDLATSQYMQGNYDGLHPPDDYAHNATSGFDAFFRLQSSAFFDQMNPDSVVIFDAFNGIVQDNTPGRENIGAFYLGENVSDIIIGRNGDDHIEGFAGNDTLLGGAGNDVLSGGADNDVIDGNHGEDVVYGNLEQDILFGGQGNDTVYGGQGNDAVYGNFGNDFVYGNFGDDFAFGGEGADRLFGGQGNDTINGDLGNDTLFGNLGADRFVFGQGAGADVVMDFSAAQGDHLDVQGQTHVISAAADGWALITLSGGGTIEMVGLTPPEIDDSFFA
jgi:Ca2+-binding RTX toxin-like protein